MILRSRRGCHQHPPTQKHSSKLLHDRLEAIASRVEAIALNVQFQLEERCPHSPDTLRGTPFSRYPAQHRTPWHHWLLLKVSNEQIALGLLALLLLPDADSTCKSTTSSLLTCEVDLQEEIFNDLYQEICALSSLKQLQFYLSGCNALVLYLLSITFTTPKRVLLW